jgi:hypothetical protein
MGSPYHMMLNGSTFSDFLGASTAFFPCLNNHSEVLSMNQKMKASHWLFMVEAGNFLEMDYLEMRI